MKKVLKITGIVLGSLIGAMALVFNVLYIASSGEVAKTVAQDSSIPHVEIDGHVFYAETYGIRQINNGKTVAIFRFPISLSSEVLTHPQEPTFYSAYHTKFNS